MSNNNNKKESASSKYTVEKFIIKNNLTGAFVLDIARLEVGQELELTKEQFHSEQIQNAIKSNSIRCL